MDNIFLMILNRGIAAGWLILAVITARYFLRRAPKWVTCMLWGVVAIRLICPIIVESPFSLNSVEQGNVYQVKGNMETGWNEDIPRLQSGIRAVDEILISHTEKMNEGTLTVKNTAYVWVPVLTVVWLLGMAGLLGYLICSYLHLKTKLRCAIRIKRNIYVCDEIQTPFVVRLLFPRIYLPSGMSKETMQCVCRHEEAHIRRLDPWWKVIGFLILTVFWLQPLMWVAYKLFCRDIELACDETVIRGMNKKGRSAYCQAMLDCSLSKRITFVSPLAFGEIGVRERIKSIMKYKKASVWMMILALGACVILVILFLTKPTQEKPQTDTGNEQSVEQNPNNEMSLPQDHNIMQDSTQESDSESESVGDSTVQPDEEKVYLDFEPEGTYTDEMGSELIIEKGTDGNYKVEFGIYKLTYMFDAIGEYNAETKVFSFEGVEDGNEPLAATVVCQGDFYEVILTKSAHMGCPVGTMFTFYKQ